MFEDEEEDDVHDLPDPVSPHNMDIREDSTNVSNFGIQAQAIHVALKLIKQLLEYYQ